MKTLFAKSGRWAAGLCLGSSLAFAASASTLLSQAYSSVDDYYLSGSNPDPTVGKQQLADDFRFAADASITGIRWWGWDIDSSQLDVRVFDDLSGHPDAYTSVSGPIAKLFVATSSDGHGIYQFDMATTLMATAGVQYYLSVWADDLYWDWLASDYLGMSAYRNPLISSWQIDVPNLALEIFGDTAAPVPEPGALALAALALAAAAAARRTRRKA